MRKNLLIAFSKPGNIYKVFPVLLFIFIATVSSWCAAIEIYARGEYFDSFEDYQDSRQHHLSDSMKLSGPIQEERQVPFISREVRQKLDKISYNSGVDHVTADFQQNGQNPEAGFIRDDQELRDVLQETMEGQHDPVLLISDPEKMRIMSYSSYPKIQKGQNQ